MMQRRTVLVLAQVWARSAARRPTFEFQRKLLKFGSLAACALLAGCAAPEPKPPVPVEIQVPVPVPCEIPVPECQTPAYDVATKQDQMDLRVKLLRVEAIEREDCLKRTRAALEACRAGAGVPAR